MEVLLCVLDFSHVKATDARDLIVPVYYCWGLALSLGEDNVHEILPKRNA